MSEKKWQDKAWGVLKVIATILIIIGCMNAAGQIIHILANGTSEASTVRTLDEYDKMKANKSAYREVFVSECMKGNETMPGAEAYCGCTADRFLEADRDTFNHVITAFEAGSIEEDMMTPYIKPCAYILES